MSPTPYSEAGQVICSADVSLSAADLADKYQGSSEGEHPVFTRAYWRDEVEQQNTTQGYFAWVKHVICEAVEGNL